MNMFTKLKLGNIFKSDIPQFSKLCIMQNIFKHNTRSFHLLQKYAGALLVHVFGHKLFLKAHSFPSAALFERCSLPGTENVHGKIQSIFLHQMEAIVYIHKFVYKIP